MRKKILIISEAPFHEGILVMEEAGFKVETAQNYWQGLKQLDKSLPDLVVIDEMLPGVNGWEACSRLRQITDIPIILLGADRRGQAVARAINQGADTYMFKPTSTNELKARVNALLRRYKKAVVAEVREPIVDVFDEGERLLVIAGLPGVEEDNIHLEVKDDILGLSAEARDRKYSKEVLLPSPVDAESMESSYKNGILEIRLRKK